MFSHGECKAIEIQFDLKMKLKKYMNKDVEMVRVPYQQAIGFFMYAMLCIQLDLAYLISVVNQHMANPSL